MKITISTAEDGDWVQVCVDGVQAFEGLSIPDYKFIEWLQQAGADVEEFADLPAEAFWR